MSPNDYRAILDKARAGIESYLNQAKADGRIDNELYSVAMANTYPAIEKWLGFPPIPGIRDTYKEGIVKHIEAKDWEGLVNAFRQTVRFGTGGIRGMMAFDRDSIVRIKNEGIDAPVLKGPNTINDLVMALTTAGVAKYGIVQKPRLQKVVIGYDSRIRGFDLARLVAEVFLAYDYTVYFFDAPCPYPEVTFAIPNEKVKADAGVLISASHNDYRYNGYKLSCANGSQFDPKERDDMYNQFISKVDVSDIKVRKFKDATKGRLFFLGGDRPVAGFDYAGHEGAIINMHELHREHVQKFLLTPNLAEQQKKAAKPVSIGFCPFHGAGIYAVPRLLHEVGFLPERVKSINGTTRGLGLNTLNGLFPAFCSDPGREQQPDPGDPRAAEILVGAFKDDYPGQFNDLDILIGTDPDADRCGIVVKIPENQRHVYGGKDYYLLPADDMWTLVLWYRLQHAKKSNTADTSKEFIVLSHTTSDSLTLLAQKHGVGVVRTWVGFASLAAATREVWEGRVNKLLPLIQGRDKDHTRLCHDFVCDCLGMDNGKRTFNIGALEQSNGFSLLGGRPPDARSMGVDGHVRDKDGTFAALLVSEIAAWAKAQGTTIIELLDKEIYLDPAIGLFATFYEPDPMDGEYPGIEGDRLKKEILLKALGYYREAASGKFQIGGLTVKSAVIYRTGKYDKIYPPTPTFEFPDEGIRFFFDDEKLQHVTIRPSGTGNSLRFHVQLRAIPTAANLIQTKQDLRQRGAAILADVRRLLGAPKN